MRVALCDAVRGADYNHSIMTGINACRAMILVFTRHSASSGPVEREVERALNRRVPVIPVRLEPCVVPTRITRRIHYVNLFPSWEAGFETILKTMAEQEERRKTKQLG